MDFSTLDLAKTADDGSEMVVNDPYAEGYFKPVMGADNLPCTVSLKGIHSPDVKEVIRAYERKVASFGIANVDSEKHGFEMVLKIVTGWSSNWLWEGKPFPYNEKNARMILTKFDWLVGQIIDYAKRPSNFLSKQPSD